MSGLVVGVDLGKTGCRALASDGARAEGAGAPGLADPGGVELALDAVRRVVAAATSAPTAALCVGAAGAMAAPEEAGPARPAARRGASRLPGGGHLRLGDRPRRRARWGARGRALGRHRGGRPRESTRADGIPVDGWGPWLGDDGGGAWIGREALRAVLRARESRGPATA